MEPVTPFGHLVDMELLMTVLSAAGVVLAGLTILAVGVFSIVSLLWEDLLENEAHDTVSNPALSEAA